MLPTDDLPAIMQIIFIVSGCDYTSFFHGCGKASFLSSFFMHANFISVPEMPGSLSETSVTNEQGLLSFYRLVGSVYYKKFSCVMLSEHKSPKQLYQSVNEAASLLQQHHQWLNIIRDNSWEKVTSEEEVMPSNDALEFHWQRCCWVSNLWGQAGK